MVAEKNDVNFKVAYVWRLCPKTIVHENYYSCSVDKCANCHEEAECVYGRCRCREGYVGTGYVCEKGQFTCNDRVAVSSTLFQIEFSKESNINDTFKYATVVDNLSGWYWFCCLVLHKQIRKKNVASVLFIIIVPRESVFVFQGSFAKVKAIFMPVEYPCYFELHRIQCFFFIA